MAASRGVAAFAAACMAWLCLSVAAQAPRPADRVVTASEQAVRDSERVRILQDELAREQAVAAEATKRRAMHLVASDAPAAEQDEQAQRRATENIAALQRELNAAVRSSGTERAAVTPVPSKATPKPTVTLSGSTGTWWDVYSKPRRTTAPDAPVTNR